MGKRGARGERKEVHGVYRRQNIRGGPTEFAAGRNFIYTYSDLPVSLNVGP